MRYGKHAAMVDSLHERLQRTNPRSRVRKETEYYYREGPMAGEMDVKVTSFSHGKVYIDYWEVKSTNSSSCRHKAYKQAQHFYTAMRNQERVVPRFTLVTPKGVTRISEDQAYHRSPYQ